MALTDTGFYNRDLSWLRFNHRVLQEAADVRNPLYERIKFIAIYSSNLDEFFKVRVSDIRQIKGLDKKIRKKLISKPNKLLKEIKAQVDMQGDELGNIWSSQIIPELAENNIDLISFNDFDDTLIDFSKEYFETELKDLISISTGSPKEGNHLLLDNEQLYLTAFDPSKGLIWANIPGGKHRFVQLPAKDNRHRIAFVDDVLRHVLQDKYNQLFCALKISKDAELYIENEYSGDLLEKIKSSLPNRDTGQVTRALVSNNVTEELLTIIKSSLEINDTDIVIGGNYHNLKDLFGFPNPTDQPLGVEALPPKVPQELQKFESMFEAIRQKDRLLYFPYESFNDVIRFVEEASIDPKVNTIKITLYRVSGESAIVKSLINAVEKGKKVTVFMETKARFDENNNIKWGKRLEECGAKVIYSYPGIKVHSKIMYVERQENDKNKAYGYIGTGNFNEKTSTIYTDFGLMTAHKDLTKELSQVFQLLEREIIIPKTKKLLVSPFTSRSKFVALIDKEIENAADGKEAHIILKLNSLQDPKMIKQLYKASKAGVNIRILVRGICCLVPGIKGQSENITVTSIVDRFLEHARVYIFANGGKEKMYMGSADWMTRNIDHRIEVITPILDPDNYDKMRQAVQVQLDDQVKARVIDAHQNNDYVSKKEGDSSQLITYHELID